MNKEKVLEHKETVVSAICSILDNIYDILDATEKAGIDDEKTETLKKVAVDYEELLKTVKEDSDLTSLQEGELLIVLNQVKTNMEIEIWFWSDTHPSAYRNPSQ